MSNYLFAWCCFILNIFLCPCKVLWICLVSEWCYVRFRPLTGLSRRLLSVWTLFAITNIIYSYVPRHTAALGPSTQVHFMVILVWQKTEWFILQSQGGLYLQLSMTWLWFAVIRLKETWIPTRERRTRDACRSVSHNGLKPANEQCPL